MKKLMSIVLLSAFSQAVLSAEPRPPLYMSPLPALPPNQEVRLDELTLRPGADGATQTARFVSFMIKTANAPAGSSFAPETP